MTVPRYGEQHVAVEPLPSVRFPTSVDPASFGVAAHINLGGLNQALDEEVQKEKRKADQVALTGADSQAASLETNILYDPEKGVLNQHGKNALNARNQFEDAWQKGVSQIEAGLHGDDQKTAFRTAMANRYASINEAVTKHIATEMDKYDDEQTQSMVNNERNAATASVVKGVPLASAADRSTLAIGRIRAADVDYAQRHGLSKEATQNLLDLDTSATHAAVISQMIANGDDLTAKSYYDEFKDQLVGRDLEQVTKEVEVGSLRGESQRQSDDILSKYPTDEESAINAAKKIKDPELRDQVQQRVEQQFNLQQEIRRNHENDLYERATQILEPYVQKNIPFVASQVIPAAMWTQLPLTARNALERRAQHADADFPNDPKVWHKFLSLTPQQMGALNQQEFETQYWSHFDHETRTRAELMWSQSRDAVRTGKTDAKMAADVTFKDLVKNALGTIDPTYVKKQTKDWGDAKYSFYANFTTEAMRRKEAEEAETGKPLTRSQMSDIINELTKERVFVDKPLSRDPYYLPGQITRDEKQNAYVPIADIPDGSVAELKQIATRNGVDATNNRIIERLYAARLMNDRTLFNQILKENKSGGTIYGGFR